MKVRILASRLGRASSAGVVLTLFVTVLALSSDGVAQQSTVFTHANVIDGTGKPPIRNATLVVSGERIVSVSAKGVRLPAGAKVVDLRGSTIMPLLINTHGHLGLVKGTSQSASNQTDDNLRHQLLRYAEYGVGAVLSMGTDGKKFAQLRDASRAGKVPGATVYTAGIGFGAKNGVPPESMGFSNIFRPESAADVKARLAEEVPQHPDVIKVWVDDFWGQYPKMKPEVYKAVIDQAHQAGLRVAAHVYHLDDARELVRDGVDILAHSIRDGDVDDALIADMKKHHVAYIPTLSLDNFAFAYGDSPEWMNDPFFRAALDPGVLEMIESAEYKAKVKSSKVTAAEQAALPVALRNLKKIYAAGLLVAMGTDSGATPIRTQGFAEHMEVILMVRAGLTPLEAITVATKNGAELLRSSKEFGTIEPGRRANFIVLQKDPSQDIRNTQTIQAVWKNGVKVSDGPLSTDAGAGSGQR